MKKSLLTIFCLLCFNAYSLSPLLEQLSNSKNLPPDQKIACLKKIASAEKIPFEQIPTYGEPVLQFFFQNKWNILDTRYDIYYLQLDNQTLADFDEIAEDPFLVLRTKVNAKDQSYDFLTSQYNLAEFKIAPLEEWPICDESDKLLSPLPPSEENSTFNPEIALVQVGSDPCFVLTTSPCDLIHWQITSDNNFIISNLDQICPFSKLIELDPISQTFINPHQNYFLKVKICQNGLWSNWSEPLSFVCTKPVQVHSVVFEKKDDRYFISWEGDASEYFLYGSNALDFVPPIYAHMEVPYLKLTTSEKQIEIDPTYAYYRIIPCHNGKYGIPSEIIYIYDHSLAHPRSVLQFDPGMVKIERMPLGSEQKQTKALNPPPHISSEIWQAVEPFLLPENHPIKGKMDRIFSKSRVVANEKALFKAGFTWTQKTVSHSGIYPTRHKKIKNFFIKLLTDVQDIADWRQWVKRAQGARDIRHFISKHDYERIFKVPQKYIYPLPEKPSPEEKTYPKYFVLLSEDMKIVNPELNEDMYKNRVTKALLNVIYKIVTELGLIDSLFIHNLCWAKDGRLAFVDTEKHHSWPVLYHRYYKILSPPMVDYWKSLVKHHGPNF